MREFGYAEGRDFEMVYRTAERHADRLPKLAAELVQLNPDVIVAPATVQAVAVKEATITIPTVVPVLADPVGLGLVESEARPGGNLTGVAPYVRVTNSQICKLRLTACTRKSNAARIIEKTWAADDLTGW